MAYRFLLAGGVLLATCLLRRELRQQLLGFAARDHGFALIVALMQFSINFNLVYIAQRYLTSGLVALLFALLLVPNAVLGAVFLGVGAQAATVREIQMLSLPITIFQVGMFSLSTAAASAPGSSLSLAYCSRCRSQAQPQEQASRALAPR